jgi:hypothetical protein
MAGEDEDFAERLRRIRSLREHWEERLEREGPAARTHTAGAFAGGAGSREDYDADPEQLLSEALRLTTLAHPPYGLCFPPPPHLTHARVRSPQTRVPRLPDPPRLALFSPTGSQLPGRGRQKKVFRPAGRARRPAAAVVIRDAV